MTKRVHFISNSSNFYANFSEKGCLDLSGDISPYMRTFPKGEFMDSVDARGNTSAKEKVGNCLPVLLTSHSSKKFI